jgi:MFS family permease
VRLWRPGRFFYGWRIVGAGFGLEALIGALLFHAYGSYVVLMREEFGWSRTLFAAAFAMARSESAILGPLQGWLTDRFGPRALMRVGMAIFGVGFILLSRVQSPVQFFLAFFVVAVGAGLGGYMPIAVAIVNWFQRRRALALGISSSGSAVGGLLTPVVVASLTTFGWRGTALLSGVVILVAGLPLAQVFRQRPALYGEYPDGLRPGDGDAPVASDGPAPRSPERPAVAPVDFTPREAMRTPAFWLVSLGHGSALLVVSAVVVHMVTHVTERLGYSLGQAATVVALLTVGQIAGHIGGGGGGATARASGPSWWAAWSGMPRRSSCSPRPPPTGWWWSSRCSTASRGARAGPSWRPSGPTTSGAPRSARSPASPRWSRCWAWWADR